MTTDPMFDSTIDGSSIIEAIPHRVEDSTQHYRVEFGVRLDDQAVVFHFFPPSDKERWSPDEHTAMRGALDQGLLGYIKPSWPGYLAEYIPELESYSVQVPVMGTVPDPIYCARKFLAIVNASLPSGR